MPSFTFAKELQMHVMEIRPNSPFRSPVAFEETMHEAVLTMQEFLQRKYSANLLGTGMHPLLRLEETGVWPHRHRQIYDALSRIFSLKRHGWLNIQSFQLNLPYANEKEGILLHNLLAMVCAYLPAVAASSPIWEGKMGGSVDNRLVFYGQNQKEVPSITGAVVPEYASSFDQYGRDVVGKYSEDLEAAGADDLLLGQEWVNSRGVIFRFERRALEIRVMDEQECIKSDVALSCFVRALLRGLLSEGAELPPHNTLMKDYSAVVKEGLNAQVQHPNGRTARQVCGHFLKVADGNATEEEKKYLPIVERRIEEGSLSEVIRERVRRRAQKTELREAIADVYSGLMKSLVRNQSYF
jgi:gamma-glutamyl:cysteine ligase YbdK (ATP-grasp superfamily)